MACLITAIDIGLFYFLNQKLNSIASAHLVSFLSAAAAGIFTLKLKPKQLFTYAVFALLVVLLRGGLLASLAPIGLGMGIGALFSATLLVFGWHYLQSLDSRDSKYWCIAAVAYLLLLKLFYLGAPELIFEEAYYWNYAQHLDYGYLDHPLMIAWIIKIFTTIFGNNEFGVRFGAFLCWFVTAYYIFKLTREAINESNNDSGAYWALLLVAALPAYFSFGWFMSPDAPLTACWAAAIYYFYQVIIKDKAKAWLGVGLALGLGMLSKYTIALLGGTFVLFLLLDKDARKWFFRREPYLALVITCVLFSPVIIWNMQHDWASFAFQSQGRVASGYHFSLPRFISNVLIFITPIGVMSAIAIIRHKRVISAGLQTNIHAPSSLPKNYLVLAWLALFPVFVFANLSLFRASKLNWTGPCWLALLPLLALLITQKNAAGASKLLAWSQRAWPATVVILMLLYGAGLHFLSLGLPFTKYPQNTHLMGFSGLGAQIETLTSKFEKERNEKILVVGMDRNKISSGLAFYRTKANGSRNAAFETASGHLYGVPSLMYKFWFPAAAQNGKTMLLVGEKSEELSNEVLQPRATPLTETEKIIAGKNGKQTGTYYYRLVKNYQAKATDSSVLDNSGGE
jgi:dolichol-phosphate mannosyltransferase